MRSFEFEKLAILEVFRLTIQREDYPQTWVLGYFTVNFFKFFILQIAKRASVAAAPLAAWVVANVKFSVVLEKIEPLENEQAQLEKYVIDISRGLLSKHGPWNVDGTDLCFEWGTKMCFTHSFYWQLFRDSSSSIFSSILSFTSYSDLVKL